MRFKGYWLSNSVAADPASIRISFKSSGNLRTPLQEARVCSHLMIVGASWEVICMAMGLEVLHMFVFQS